MLRQVYASSYWILYTNFMFPKWGRQVLKTFFRTIINREKCYPKLGLNRQKLNFPVKYLFGVHEGLQYLQAESTKIINANLLGQNFQKWTHKAIKNAFKFWIIIIHPIISLHVYVIDLETTQWYCTQSLLSNRGNV